MNRTSTKAVDGKTPFEAAFGKKPKLRDVREWGETIWVRVEGGTKLGGRVREGRWFGINEQSKGVRVYWPDKKFVTVERNVYYDETAASASRLEGEIDGIIETKANVPAKPFEKMNAPTSSPTIDPPAPDPTKMSLPPRNVSESPANALSI